MGKAVVRVDYLCPEIPDPESSPLITDHPPKLKDNSFKHDGFME